VAGGIREDDSPVDAAPEVGTTGVGCQAVAFLVAAFLVAGKPVDVDRADRFQADWRVDHWGVPLMVDRVVVWLGAGCRESTDEGGFAESRQPGCWDESTVASKAGSNLRSH
jgi:hypothetical protein